VTNKLAQVLADAHIWFDYVPFGENLGHGGGQNRLAGLSTGSGLGRHQAAMSGEQTSDPDPGFLVMINPDVYMVPTALSELLGSLRDPQVGIAEARQIPLEHPKPYDLGTGETPWASGCAMALPFGLFCSLGGFDPAFFLYGDDVDLSWRVRMSGKVVRHVVSSAVFHDKRPAASGFPDPTPEEESQGMLARLLLAHRAERPEVIDEWLAWTASNGTAQHREGAATFRDRQQNGHLPVAYRELLSVDAQTVATVATFVEGEYAEHRF
jgi:GT2 family glycosyltransferase